MTVYSIVAFHTLGQEDNRGQAWAEQSLGRVPSRGEKEHEQEKTFSR